MGLKVDPPDFIDSGSYKPTDFSGLGQKGIGLVAGTAFAGAAIAIGVGGARWLEGEFSQRTGMETENSSGDTITVV